MTTKAPYRLMSAPDALTKLLAPSEAEVMRIVWRAARPLQLRQVRAIIATRRNVAHTAVMTTMVRLAHLAGTRGAGSHDEGRLRDLVQPAQAGFVHVAAGLSPQALVSENLKSRASHPVSSLHLSGRSRIIAGDVSGVLITLAQACVASGSLMMIIYRLSSQWPKQPHPPLPTFDVAYPCSGRRSSGHVSPASR